MIYNDQATIYQVASTGYRGSKSIVDKADIDCIFIRGTGMQQGGFQENVTADDFLYLDIESDFIINHNYRLEGMYVLLSLFNDPDAASWYKIVECVVNRDHLLLNQIDNVQCRLKKTTALPGTS